MNKDLYRHYSKPQLMTVCRELGIEVSMVETSVAISEKFVTDVLDNGVPEKDTCSKLLMQILQTLGVVDENGDIVESLDEAVEDESLDYAAETSTEADKDMPDCFGFADNKDPACEHCKVKEACMEKRIADKPSCLGSLYDPDSEECKICIEADECKERME